MLKEKTTITVISNTYNGLPGSVEVIEVIQRIGRPAHIKQGNRWSRDGNSEMVSYRGQQVKTFQLSSVYGVPHPICIIAQ